LRLRAYKPEKAVEKEPNVTQRCGSKTESQSREGRPETWLIFVGRTAIRGHNGKKYKSVSSRELKPQIV